MGMRLVFEGKRAEADKYCDHFAADQLQGGKTGHMTVNADHCFGCLLRSPVAGKEVFTMNDLFDMYIRNY